VDVWLIEANQAAIITDVHIRQRHVSYPVAPSQPQTPSRPVAEQLAMIDPHRHATNSTRDVFRGRGLAPAPPPLFQPTRIFYDGIFDRFTIFSSKTAKFRHSLTKKRQLPRSFPPNGANRTILKDRGPDHPLDPLLLHIPNIHWILPNSLTLVCMPSIAAVSTTFWIIFDQPK